MKNVFNNILEAVGHTPLVKLNTVTAGIKGTLYAKVEYVNPGGSVKDRIALQIIEDAEKQGLLKPGGTIVEATSGNTGAGLAMAAAVKGYKCVFVMPDKQSEEKRAALRAYGAKVVITPTDVEADDPRSYYSVSRRIAEETPNAYYANQYHNPSNPLAHYLSTGPELYDQIGDKIDAFIAGLGTGGTISGISKYIKERRPEMKTIGVDPVGSLYYDFFKTGQMTPAYSYVVEGIGEDFLPSTIDFQYVDDVVRVNDKECMQMTRRLAREEGLLIGGSCGAAVAGALKWMRANDRPDLVAVVLLPDSGTRYLSKIYNDTWMEENGFLSPLDTLGTVRDVLDTIGARETISVPDHLPVPEAIARMKQHGISQMPVTNDGRVVGVLHENRVLEHLLKRGASAGARAADLADLDYTTVSLDTEVSVVSELLRKARIVLAYDGSALAGVLTRIDIIDHVARVAHQNPPAA